MRSARAGVLALVVACGGDKDQSTPVDSGDADQLLDTGSVDPLCVDAPVVTWSSWGEGFVSQNCQSCHRSTTTDRRGAPEEVTFDTEDSALSHADRILARAAGEAPTMPPSGGVSEDDRYLLEVWLTCWR